MRIGISNIAWDPSEDAEVARLLRHYEVDAVDIAPSKYFPDVHGASRDDVVKVRHWWAERGFEITGMQALMFGTEGLNVFGPADVQEAMLRHLEGVCRIGAMLGCKALVFGSPKNRDRGGKSDLEAEEVAVPFFRRLGEIARRLEVAICVEPCPARYGGNFLTTSAETAAFVRSVASPNILMQLDTGALTLSGEVPADTVAACRSLIGHVHASEPGLVPLGDGGCGHLEMARSIRRYLGEALVVIEMVAPRAEPHLGAIERALRVALESYRSGASAGEAQ